MDSERPRTEHGQAASPYGGLTIEVDVDALGDGDSVHVAGIIQHVEEAGVHSGDSACVIPPLSLGEEMLEEIRSTTERLALELGVIGLINIQYAIAEGRLYVIEANPRASRTVPFVSKAIGVPLAKVAARLMLGEKLAGMDLPTGLPEHVSVRRRCCRSPASPAPIRCSARR